MIAVSTAMRGLPLLTVFSLLTILISRSSEPFAILVFTFLINQILQLLIYLCHLLVQVLDLQLLNLHVLHQVLLQIFNQRISPALLCLDLLIKSLCCL